MAGDTPEGEKIEKKPAPGKTKPAQTPVFLEDAQQDLKDFELNNYKVGIELQREWFKLHYQVDIKLVDKEEQFGVSEYLRPIKDFKNTLEVLKKLRMQLVKIPPAFFAKLEIKKFVIAGKIVSKDQMGLERGIAAASHPGDSNMYFKVAWPFYHEFFHIMDGKFAGGLDSSGAVDVDRLDYYKKSGEQHGVWRKLDPEGTKDIDGEGIDEQQAEYSRVLFNLDNKEVYEDQYKAQIEPNVPKMKKLAQMKKWLLEWSGGLFNEQYWDDLKAGKVDENYWQKRGK